MELTTIHYISLILVLLLSFVPGWYMGRKVKSADDYNIGGRNAGAFLVSGAIIGTAIGGAATIGTAQMAFKFGLCAWWFTLGVGIALLLMAFFYAKPLRNSGLTTISEFLVINYGKTAGPVACITATMGIFFSIVASSLTSIHLFSGLLHLDHLMTAGIILFIVIAFVFYGGIGGSGGTGIFKMFLLFITLTAAGVIGFSNFGGLEGMHASFPEEPWFDLFGNGMEASLYSLASLIVGMLSTQTYIQALFSAKDSKTAAVGCVTAALITIPVGLPSVIIGMYMKLHHPDIMAIDALPMFFATYLPPWLGGAALTGLILSSIGSVSGLSLGCGTMISRDIFGDLLHVEDSKKLLWINRFSVVIITILALTFVMYNLDSYVLHWNYLSMALRGAGIFLPLTFAIMFKGKILKWWGFAAMVAGIVVSLFWKFIVPTAGNTLFPGLVANLIFLIPGVLCYKNKKNI